MVNQKSVLREETKQKLIQLSQEKKQIIQEKLYSKLWVTPDWNQAEIIGLTISQGYEWDTKPIIEEAWKQGKKVVVPKCYPKQKHLIFYQLEDFNQLETVYYQLQEPDPNQTIEISSDCIDLVIVPGLVFDYNHYRIGHGGGYYDRFLENFKGTTISLAWSEQLIRSIPVEPFDISINELIVCS
ncbi:5-formyltetrahydrofolate cyclo-ligase family protein [Paraliobacillus sp. PM-2]|uniref:5-formyltetrahydrofolate cyclo-ligase n=1 Tax=Paraliobacillus sp. PM-2 TaxID=1462524 RepID=UPI00061C9330|nr:5-formyltetrahydrofolate cyclo-ligase [Paraliobacillus sp. PM-2]CQR46847.1 5-formyltetrahydrofolate cyclo-ligase family protein [Paraliobacillus sp. PM-2]